MPSCYTFTDYSPDWPLAFERAATRLRELLADELIAIHHIGSTSVPGLAAKPIIDLLPVARSIAAIEEQTPQLESAGYKAWGEYGLPGRRYFTQDHGGYRTHNIHIYGQDNPDIERHLAFRDFLRAHPTVRDEYAAIKRAAYTQHPADIAAYSDSKHAWIQTVEVQALAWYRQSNRNPT
ncbi:GrpB family protein [Leptolyngbya sp. PCC 6406]|uniref:GrpB family protein n=1 Tax=Leptolyngbya sp. PCC 6406 TaxID=1173264 RepID=UPI0002ABE8EA|nr:GrpB family protein [Leptolyngbya sp. PCC 6406]